MESVSATDEQFVAEAPSTMSYQIDDNVDLVVSCISDDDDIAEYYLEEIVDNQETNEVAIGESDDDEVEIVETTDIGPNEPSNGDDSSDSRMNVSPFAFEMF